MATICGHGWKKITGIDDQQEKKMPVINSHREEKCTPSVVKGEKEKPSFGGRGK